MIERPSLVPELRLHLATEITPIWQASEAALGRIGIDPPFWAFAWPGGQAIARYLLDHPARVTGLNVLDFGAGSGIAAIAAARAGASHVMAVDIDPVAVRAIALNAGLNGVSIETVTADLIGSDPGADLILVGDMCYEQPLATRLMVWLRALAAKGRTVLLGDPGRNYSPTDGLVLLASYTVVTSLELEDRTERRALVWQVLAGP